MAQKLTLLGIVPEDYYCFDRLSTALRHLRPQSISCDFDIKAYHRHQQSVGQELAKIRDKVGRRKDLSESQIEFLLTITPLEPNAFVAIRSYLRHSSATIEYVGEFERPTPAPSVDLSIGDFSLIECQVGDRRRVNLIRATYQKRIEKIYAQAQSVLENGVNGMPYTGVKKQKGLATEIEKLAKRQPPHLFIGNLDTICSGYNLHYLNENLADLSPKIHLLRDFQI